MGSRSLGRKSLQRDWIEGMDGLEGEMRRMKRIEEVEFFDPIEISFHDLSR
jgi:hypothetical protein